MFQVTPNPTFWAPVALSIPGKAEPVEVQMQFKHMPPEEFGQFLSDIKDKPELDCIKLILLDWKEVDGPFNEVNLKTLLANYHRASREIFAAWRTELAESKRKN